MQRAIGLLGLLIAVAIGGYIFTQQAKKSSPDAGNPRTEIDVTGVRMDLINMAQAERAYYAREGHYASLDDMRASGDLLVRHDNRGPYTYSATYSDQGFEITATYNGPPQPEAPQSLHVDQNMQVSQ
jgi:hypothetical protein